ncbi:hypothetical protein GQ37_006170 [Janthinobacterium sp. BJB1]|uniref:hypothetical protein n=1 Tax=Janthinobacterium sp. GW458P TaxID=1981504 RepID=UPI000A327566|nr:hypothetical protein [Janthinobacterium sp. GW458P]MBE3024699.1 hypothetical protein [Janthinobacterium sp. GW458P]PHV17990.1 hypothetical protein CSQ90_06715 [Janthinobacterium sp. BJB303]PJC99882.1 hypothetical protein GQ37_006170 [Janthinobacterium sp. BJB1]
MAIEIKASEKVQANAASMKVRIVDNGKARVRLEFRAGDILLDFDDINATDLTKTFENRNKGTNNGYIFLDVYEYDGMGKNYDSKVFIDGKVIAKAKGTIKTGKDSGYAKIELTLI